MTEHSGRHRRASGALGLASRGTWWLVVAAGTSGIVLVAAILSITIDRGSVEPDASPTQSLAASDIPVVAPLSTTARSFTPVATGPPTSNSSPTPGQGIRAQRIQIDRLRIDLKIVDGDGIDAPIDKAAHYPGTGWPDGGTNIYIYGHAQTGMFLSLWDVEVGDRVILTLVDGTQRTYLVATVIPKVPWNALRYLDPTPTEQLTLQTSTSYGPTAPRFIAIAYPTP